MRSQHKFVITATLLCHLFLAVPLVTSQAHPEQEQTHQVPANSAPPSQQFPSAGQPGNCHLVITSPPRQAQTGVAPGPGRNGSQSAPAKKGKVPISAENPVIIDARECEKLGT